MGLLPGTKGNFNISFVTVQTISPESEKDTASSSQTNSPALSQSCPSYVPSQQKTAFLKEGPLCLFLSVCFPAVYSVSLWACLTDIRCVVSYSINKCCIYLFQQFHPQGLISKCHETFSSSSSKENILDIERKNSRDQWPI